LERSQIRRFRDDEYDEYDESSIGGPGWSGWSESNLRMFLSQEGRAPQEHDAYFEHRFWRIRFITTWPGGDTLAGKSFMGTSATSCYKYLSIYKHCLFLLPDWQIRLPRGK